MLNLNPSGQNLIIVSICSLVVLPALYWYLKKPVVTHITEVTKDKFKDLKIAF